jgi:predicted acylesterase/phospholipase RssA
MDASKEPLKVLSLDGGGCRGQGQILLLRHLFGHLPLNCPVDDVKPCDYFDLICGTSSGGIVALMLARLEMTIGEALDSFQKFTRDVFGKDEVLDAYLDGGNYELDRLEEAVGHMLEGKGLLMRPTEEELKSRVGFSHYSQLRLMLL